MGDTVKFVTRPAVPILDTGTWDTSTGTFTWDGDDLAAAVEAQACPAIRTPVLKLGHCDPRFDGQPAVGRIEAMRVSTNGQTLVADFEGMPEWLADILPSAYPSRSIEGEFDYVCAAGHTHRFVVTAVALLGVTEPAVGTLADIADLYGLVAAEAPHGGRVIAATFKEKPMPVRAAVPESAIYEEFYENAPPGSWAWIREVWVGDNAFIIVDDDDGDLWRIPYTESNGDISFGTPEAVIVQYVPAPADDEADDKAITLAARNWGEGGPKTVAASAAVNPAPPVKGASLVDLTKLRARLGLPEDASEEDIEAKLTELEEAATKPPVEPKAEPAALPEGVVAIDESTLADLKVAAARGQQAHETLRKQERDTFLDTAVKAGKFAPARREHFSKLYDADEDGTKTLVASLAANTVPVTELGNAGGGPEGVDLFEQLFPHLAAQEKVNG